MDVLGYFHGGRGGIYDYDVHAMDEARVELCRWGAGALLYTNFAINSIDV